ncbi:MAG TPA: MotA/TolQ/ExbB proton channel family protein [Rhabdochlamydiaceae bacterium]|jgi:biopolymer transport protein ExbB
MKSIHLLTLCLVPFLSTYAESPIEENSPAELIAEDDLFLDEEVCLLDDETAPEVFLPALDELDDELLVEITNPALDAMAQQPIVFAPPPERKTPKMPFIEEPAPSLAVEKPTAKIKDEPPAILNVESSTSDMNENLDVELDLKRAFTGSPIIYTLLGGMSMFSLFIWLYSLLALKRTAQVPHQMLTHLQNSLNGNHFDEALSLCVSQDTLLCKMVASGIQARKYGPSAMIESMKAEGKRSSIGFWQKIGLLNDVAIVAPMLGLLGTVLGMFYAFYDVNRSIESITSLFDGLGISVGTTVAGLVVAILALILHSTAKYRLVRVLAQIESDAHSVASLIDSHATLYSSKSQ